MSLVLNVEILGEYKKLTQATKGASKQIEGLRDKFLNVGKAIGKTVATIGVGMGAAVASQIKPAIDAASDLGESVNAVNVAFGEAADGVLNLGQKAATGLGLSKTELYGISVQFSAFAKNIAGEGGNVVEVVDQIASRGADFASVFNLEVSDALAKFQSGLAGETEPLRKFGIDLSAAAVKAHAMENGIGSATGELTEQEKVLARYSLLMEQTDMVQGDFINTSDGLANQTRIAQATFEDLRAEIGERMLPVMQNIMGFILDELIPAIKDFYDELTDPAGEASRQVEAIGDAWEIFVNTFKFGAGEVKNQDVFAWIGDSVVSTIKNLTHLSTFVGEIFSGMAKIFQAGFSLGPLANALRAEGIRQVTGAMGAAQAAANAIQFSNEIYRDQTLGTAASSPSAMDITININRATVDADSLLDDLDAALRARGLDRIAVK